MNNRGIMRRARRQILVIASTTFIVPLVFAQAPAAKGEQDLDVTMRIIVDPDAKVPDEVVHRIPLPKPQAATPATPAQPDKEKKDNPGNKDKDGAANARDQGREFGQETAEQARQRADEAKRNGKPDRPPPPPHPPNNPPGQQ